jgi:hypothetical protein
MDPSPNVLDPKPLKFVRFSLNSRILDPKGGGTGYMTSILDRFRSLKTETGVGAVARELPQVERNGHVRRVAYVVTRAEQAPCTCPEFCERDHGNE